MNKGRCAVLWITLIAVWRMDPGFGKSSWEMTMVGLVSTGDANIGDAEYTG